MKCCFLLCFQVTQGNRSLSRLQERLGALEEELVSERRHCVEEMQMLTHQMESLRQTGGLDTGKYVTSGQVLAKIQDIKETFIANPEASIIANLRLAFKQEKQENVQFKRAL